ncbi:uncharacterized protein LY79DRAFT_645265 [Colletotrichum navitas]|uniref:Uncharacterized protein n=1 Tax=Colletotrichum navitas TaxID=681940 RepID=A0AAD8UWU7_9PEZI|nr:uncharacterized protein LY79DRAFT_645265 [Colletotrichum navitas]KAK1561633.1 hypothetical protein LY79DRAFT_645265 [Colletotrichum navitas]
MLDHEFCTWRPSFNHGNDICTSMYTHSEVLHRVFRYQYSPQALGRSVLSAHDRCDRLKARYCELGEWLNSLPTPLNKAHDHIFIETLRHKTQQLRRAFHIFIMYRRAIFFIHCPWVSLTTFLGDKSDSGVTEQMREPCIERCIKSATSVIKLASSGLFLEEELGISTTPGLADMGQLLLISLFCIIHHLVYSKKANRKELIPYLAIFGGFLGRLSLDNEALLPSYLELVHLLSAS